MKAWRCRFGFHRYRLAEMAPRRPMGGGSPFTTIPPIGWVCTRCARRSPEAAAPGGLR